MLEGSGPQCASGNIFTVDHVKLQLIKVASAECCGIVSVCTLGAGQKVEMLSCVKQNLMSGHHKSNFSP